MADSLIEAIDNDDLATVTDLVVNHKVEINAKNNTGTALTWSALKGRNHIALFLLRNGAKKRSTALHIAIQKKNVELIKYCLIYGADPNRTSNFGMTAFELAFSFDIDLKKIILAIWPDNNEQKKKVKGGFWSALFAKKETHKKDSSHDTNNTTTTASTMVSVATSSSSISNLNNDATGDDVSVDSRKSSSSFGVQTINDFM
ncbi:hypothetical protein ABK040_004783 [Willaertia magna]